jgi:hypothetical protein
MKLSASGFQLPAGSRQLEAGGSKTMRFVNIYLIGYFLLVMGALAALWYGGVLRQISPVWIIIGLVIAFGLGIMLSVSAGKPEITREG